MKCLSKMLNDACTAFIHNSFLFYKYLLLEKIGTERRVPFLRITFWSLEYRKFKTQVRFYPFDRDDRAKTLWRRILISFSCVYSGLYGSFRDLSASRILTQSDKNISADLTIYEKIIKFKLPLSARWFSHLDYAPCVLARVKCSRSAMKCCPNCLPISRFIRAALSLQFSSGSSSCNREAERKDPRQNGNEF